MPNFLVDLGDRVGSTAVQAFAGSLGAASLLSLGDWKTAVVTAAGAALFAAVKALGVAAAQAKTQFLPAVEKTAQADEQAVVKAIGEKLKG